MPDYSPAWMKKHPCVACGTGYGACAQGLRLGLMCCDGWLHPSRWEPNPYTNEDRAEWGAAS